MNYISSDLYVFIEKALAEGKKPDADGYYIFTKMELLDGAGVTASSLNKEKSAWHCKAFETCVVLVAELSTVQGGANI